MDIYLKDSDEEAVVDFVKDPEELYYKTNEHFKDKVRMDCLWKRFASSQEKLTQSKSGQAPKGMIEMQNWI